jgi:hypothetical protein
MTLDKKNYAGSNLPILPKLVGDVDECPVHNLFTPQCRQTLLDLLTLSRVSLTEPVEVIGQFVACRIRFESKRRRGNLRDRMDAYLDVDDTSAEGRDEGIHNMEVASSEDREDQDGVKRKPVEMDLVLFRPVFGLVCARDSSVMIVQALGTL